MPFAWNWAFLWRYLMPRCSWISVRTKSLISKDLLGPQIKTTHKLQHPGRNIHEVHLPTPWSEFVILLEAKGKFGSFDPCPNFSKKKKRLDNSLVWFFYFMLFWLCPVGPYFPHQGLNSSPGQGKHRILITGPPWSLPGVIFFFF